MVTDEMVEQVAREACIADGQNPDKLSHNSFQWWRHYVPVSRAALKAALSAQDTGAIAGVRVKDLAWSPRNDHPQYEVCADTPFGRYKTCDKGEYGFGWMQPRQTVWSGFLPTLEAAKAAAQADYTARILSALEPQERDGWKDIDSLEPDDGMIIIGYGEYRERDGFSPAFMRWSKLADGWFVTGLPFYPTHWMPSPAAPPHTEGK